ncbi:ABC transporter ATP-binding protein [uncultured Porphyromonas sp.]|uniref:metal ABC transporter ATP-binding protein n=1 Tax=uncultured Porphyromonas sp. TaxID=159274 RepID=UPI00261EE5E4|nr:ABC transporter ATP-binding protein [uncultured Porphyromonas sp.]
MAERPIIIAENVELGYGEEPSLLSGVNFKLFPNEFVGITGPNGAGKTTFIRALLGLISPRSGSIRYFSKEGRAVKEISIGYMPQQNQLDREFPISVEEVVLSGLFGRKTLRATSEMRALAKEALEAVGMTKFANRAIGHLSGGQLQRVLLARAFVSKPMLLVLDEPSTYVDREFEASMLSLLPSLQKESAIVMVSHNEVHLRALASRVYHIDHTFILNSES